MTLPIFIPLFIVALPTIMFAVMLGAVYFPSMNKHAKKAASQHKENINSVCKECCNGIYKVVGTEKQSQHVGSVTNAKVSGGAYSNPKLNSTTQNVFATYTIKHYECSNCGSKKSRSFAN